MRSYPPLVRRVLLTLAYYDQFQFPLTTNEIYSRIIGLPKVSNRAVLQSLLWLIANDCISVECRDTENFFQLTYRHGLAAQRLARYRFSKEKLAELRPLLTFTQFLPWVEAVAVTGSVAVHNAQLSADTDLLIVTRPGSLWLVRPILIFFAWMRGKRRSWRSEEPNSWCFNLWLESTELAVAQRARSVYTAHEVVQIQWLLDRTTVAYKFKVKNRWVSNILPKMYHNGIQVESISSAVSVFGDMAEILLKVFEPVWRILNGMLYLIQRLYMQPHKTREHVSFRAAFFHPRDTKSQIEHAWRRSIRQLTAQTWHSPAMQSAGQLPEQVKKLLESARQAGQRVVLVTGVFDVLHEEHVTFLEKAALQGDFLLVGVESDARVREIKGKNRPVFSEQVRAQQIADIPSVSAVVVLPALFTKPAEHNEFLEVVRPDILAVSAQSSHIAIKRRAVEAVGGSLAVVHEHNPLISSTQLIAEQVSSHAV